MTPLNFILVFIGGGAGSSLRYLIQLLTPRTELPLSTLIVNIVGSFLIGLALGLDDSLSKRLLITGFLGGFTTFSTFSNDNLQLLVKGKYTMFLIYFLTTLFTSLIATGIGYYISKMLNNETV
ncbi:fluoride efflux transporter CrcB [bacterium]|jgi:fluoride exporter|nr:fluoride efflux transporter CrcB [bacterium]